MAFAAVPVGSILLASLCLFCLTTWSRVSVFSFWLLCICDWIEVVRLDELIGFFICTSSLMVTDSFIALVVRVRLRIAVELLLSCQIWVSSMMFDSDCCWLCWLSAIMESPSSSISWNSPSSSYWILIIVVLNSRYVSSSSAAITIEWSLAALGSAAMWPLIHLATTCIMILAASPASKSVVPPERVGICMHPRCSASALSSMLIIVTVWRSPLNSLLFLLNAGA